MLNYVHCALKGKNGHHQGMEYKHPTSANSVTTHCDVLAAFWSTTDKGMLRFKIET